MGSQLQKPLPGTQINWRHPLSRGLVGYWVMNEGAGDRIYDLSGNGNEGELQGGTGWIAGGIDFDGSTGYVDLGTDKIFLDTGRPFTLVGRGKVDAWEDSYAYPIILTLKTNSGSFVFGVSNDELSSPSYYGLFFGSNDAGWTRQRTGYPPAKMLGFTRDYAVSYNGAGATIQGNFKAYVDGMSQTLTATGAFAGLDARNIIGTDVVAGGNEWNGLLSFVSVYNQELTLQEIAELYLNPYGMFEHVPIWMMRQVAGWAHKFCGVASPGKVDGVTSASIGKVMGVGV